VTTKCWHTRIKASAVGHLACCMLSVCLARNSGRFRTVGLLVIPEAFAQLIQWFSEDDAARTDAARRTFLVVGSSQMLVCVPLAEPCLGLEHSSRAQKSLPNVFWLWFWFRLRLLRSMPCPLLIGAGRVFRARNQKFSSSLEVVVQSGSAMWRLAVLRRARSSPEKKLQTVDTRARFSTAPELGRPLRLRRGVYSWTEQFLPSVSRLYHQDTWHSTIC
jgi:hypothetical protein